MAYGRDYAGAAKIMHLALAKLDRLQLAPGHKLAIQVSAYNHLMGLEVLRGGVDTARDLLKSHPLMAAKADILARGHFANGNEFDFALAEEFVRLMSGDPARTGWGDLMTMPPRWTKDREEILSFEAFGQAAVGLQLVKAGRTDEARRTLVAAARKRLDVLREEYRQSAYAAPLPRWVDIVLGGPRRRSNAFAGEPRLRPDRPGERAPEPNHRHQRRRCPHQPGRAAFGRAQADGAEPADHPVPAGRLGEGPDTRPDQARPVVRRR